jgi:hypothetical protein
MGSNRRTAPSAFSPGAARRLSLSVCVKIIGASTCAICCAAWTRTARRHFCSTKEQLIQWVYDNALMPAGEYWDYQLIQNYIYPRATFGEEPYASKLKAAPDEMIRMFKPDEIHVVVVGGETNGYWRIMGCNYQKTVSVDEWR